MKFAVSEDAEGDNFKKARTKFSEFWSKVPNAKDAGAHGINYDFTRKQNVGKNYIISYKKAKWGNDLILIQYKRISP